MNESKSTKAQNLARIRDNQRRSRARRKEYLQELESKLRNCEQAGVEASAEIQNAARKVLEENRRLRVLLRTRGVPEAEVAAALGVSDKSLEQASSAPALVAMLEHRWACNAQGPSEEDAYDDTSSETASVITPSQFSPPIPLAIPPQSALSMATTSANRPSSNMSSIGTPSSIRSAPFFPTEAASVPDLKAASMMQYGYPYDANPSQSTWASTTTHPNYLSDPGNCYNTTSCVNAANIIRTMRADAGPELEVDLGCHSAAQDCRVPNPTVFNVMEKYSYPSLRM